MSSIVARAWEMALQAANSTYEESDRRALGIEIDAMKGQLLTLANTKVAGTYIFGGFQTDSIAIFRISRLPFYDIHWMDINKNRHLQSNSNRWAALI